VVDQKESKTDDKQVEGKIRLRIKPYNQTTKDRMKELDKNHLIMVNTTAEK